MKRCDHCGSSDLLIVRFDGLEGATFVYCRLCESRQWRRGLDQEMAVAAVLEAAGALPAVRRRRRRKAAS